jgi:hypothetical protein
MHTLCDGHVLVIAVSEVPVSLIHPPGLYDDECILSLNV